MKYRRMQFNAQLQDENAELTRQLAASQVYAEQLREALETLNKVSNIGCCRVEKALSIPHDTSALDAYVAEKVSAARNIDEKQIAYLLEERSALTRQRDLAVDALEKQGHSAGCRKNAFGDICTCGLDDLLSTIKESEAMAQGEKGV